MEQEGSELQAKVLLLVLKTQVKGWLLVWSPHWQVKGLQAVCSPGWNRLEAVEAVN